MTAKELISQFTGVLVYASGNKDFASLAALSAKGIKGVKEEVFIELGEEVYLKHLAKAIYPESRALVASHLAKRAFYSNSLRSYSLSGESSCQRFRNRRSIMYPNGC